MGFKRTADGKLEPLKRTPEEVLDLVKKERIRFIDLQFTDGPGRLQHVTIPSHALDVQAFKEGTPKLDGSSIRGFVDINESDMLLRPDASTYAILPWSPENMKTARLICDVFWGFGLGRLSRDPRAVAQQAEEVLRKEGYDLSYWGPEIEFFIFDRVYWNTITPFEGMSYRIESKEAIWNTEGGKNFPIRFKEGYYPAPPQDTLQDYRSECVRILEDNFNIPCDAHHHEVATAGQAEMDMYRDSLTSMADNVVTYKHVAKNVAYQRDMVATFMPKPIFMDNASGMHTHVSLWNKGKPLFYDPNDEYAELSQVGRYFGGGLMEHSRALCAIVAPTTNSYRRLVPGYEAPVFIAWSRRNRSANVRVPVYQRGQHVAGAKRLEFRTPDPSCNPYFTFAAMAAAGLDGIRRKIDIGDPIDEDIYKLTPERRRQLGVRELPGSLLEAVEELENDSKFLEPLFPNDAVDKITENAKKESLEIAIRPHPHEFYLYFDI